MWLRNPDPFLKRQNQRIFESLIKSFIQFVFIVCQFEGCRNILKLSYDHLLLRHFKFLKKKIK